MAMRRELARPVQSRHLSSGAIVCRVILLRVLGALCIASLAACFSVEFQQPGQPIEPHAGMALLVGRLQVFDETGHRSTVQPTLYSSMYLMHLGISGTRSVEPGLNPDADGQFALWVPPGDYALVAPVPSYGTDTDANMYTEELALLRVPAGELVVYTGNLVITAKMVVVSEGFFSQRTYFTLTPARVVADPMETVQKALEQRYGPLERPPVAGLWCIGHSLGIVDPLNAGARAVLDSNCGNSP
jgi:hypothetical protein